MVPRLPASTAWERHRTWRIRCVGPGYFCPPCCCTEALDPARSPAGGVLLLHGAALPLTAGAICVGARTAIGIQPGSPAHDESRLACTIFADRIGRGVADRLQSGPDWVHEIKHDLAGRRGAVWLKAEVAAR
jgi:hypothetical protein